MNTANLGRAQMAQARQALRTLETVLTHHQGTDPALLTDALLTVADGQAWLFAGWMIGWTLAFTVVCWLKGERPAWRWGRRG